MTNGTPEDIWKHVTDVIVEMLAERGEEPGPLAPETRINADLGIASVDAIHLMIMLEDRVQTPLNFQDLAVRDGEYVADITVGELHAFVCAALGVTTG